MVSPKRHQSPTLVSVGALAIRIPKVEGNQFNAMKPKCVTFLALAGRRS